MKWLIISFSSGETSAYMAQRLLREEQNNYDRIISIFANTGKEKEESLIFANKCDKAFGLNLIWVEALTNPEFGKGVEARVVNFETASRKGEPFEDMIKKHGIPNLNYKHCSRELKGNAIKAYLRNHIGNNYEIAIGIRADEFDRMSDHAKEYKIIYPLVKWGITKLDVNTFWNKQNFRLELKSYEGNCEDCWKKELRKLLTIRKERIERGDTSDWCGEMEEKYGNYIPEHRKKLMEERGKTVKLPITFFRNYLSSKDITHLALTTDFKPARDNSKDYNIQENLFDELLDTSNGCSSSCEVEFD